MDFSNEQIMTAPMARVEAMYWDPQYCPRKYRELGLRDVEVIAQSKTDAECQIVCRFKMKPSLEVPKVAQKFIGGSDWLSVTQTDRWNLRTRKGQLHIVIDALKAFTTINVDMSLEPHPQGAVNRMRWSVECSIPLVGGALARFLAQDIQSKFADDCAAANRILQDY